MKQSVSLLLAVCTLVCAPWLLQSQALPSPVLLTPANNAANLPSTVTLRWKATAGADQYKVALGTTIYAEGSIVWDTTYTDTSKIVLNLAPGAYYWRVKAKHAANPYQASAWSGVWRFDVSAPSGPLATPTLITPVNGATGQPSVVNLSWQAVAGATQYKVSLGTSSAGGGDIVFDTSYVGTSRTTPALPPGTYYWRIKAKKLNPYQASAWSELRSFTVSAPNGPLATPILVSPASGATIQSPTVTLSWQAVSGANQYKISLGTTPGGNNILSDTSYIGTSRTTPALPPGTYHWRIMAKKTYPYQTSAWSETRAFSVVPTPLGATTLVSPSNGSTLQVLGTKMVWNAVTNATFYKVRLATDAAMTNIIFQDDNVTGTSRVAQNLAYNTTYYWTVQASNATVTGPVSSARTFTTMPDNPNAVTSHPRLLITQADLPTIQAWATSSNPVYVALQAALTSAINTYNSKFYPGGVENPNWPDNGGTTWSGYVTEQYAEFFAFWSLIDPNVANRPIHAQRAKKLLMYVMDRAILGPSAGVPFRDPLFMTYDRSRVYGEAFALTVDWIYNAKDASNNDILTVADKATIRTVFMRWCEEQLSAYNHPTPIGLMNDKQITLTNRWILNNYYAGHARNLTLMSLSIDAANDAPLNANLHYSALGNSLRSYIYNATGAWLYQEYAQYEKPEIVAADYGVPMAGLGMGSGGLSVEGSLYGESVGWVSQSLLALKTAGWADENVIGKQARLLTSDYWTRLMDGMLHSVAPVPYVPSQAPYYGEIYPVANYGDLLRTWVTPFMLDVTAPIGLTDMKLGNNQTRLDKCRWYTRNVIEGGNTKVAQHISQIWNSSLATHGIYYFLLLPPGNSNPPDPRPAMEKTFWDNSWQKVLARTDWTPNARWFNWQCHWTKINHQAGDGNQFEFYRKGEWLTKERSGYTNDNIGTTSEFHNTLALQNDVPPYMQWYEGPISQRGGQWKEGLNAGDPTATKSFGENYVYATGDATNLYNRYSGASDIEYASRSIVWLKPDHIIVYDRAKSKTANRFKRFFLQFTAAPTVSGKNVTVTTPGGQKVYLSNLLPAASVVTSSVSENLDVLAQLEQTTHQIKIEDPSNPQDVRFLNILQGADGNAAKDPATLVQSSAGTAFEGTVVHNTAVLFSNVWGAAFTSTTYTIPVTATTQIVTGLVPNAGYNVAQTLDGGNVTVTITTGNQLTADAGGVLLINTASFGGGVGERTADGHEVMANGSFQALPNPFSERTTIRYELLVDEQVTMEVFDLSGKKLSTLVAQEMQAAGQHEVILKNEALSTGMYLCKLTVGRNQQRILIALQK